MASATAKRRVADAVHEDRVMQPIDALRDYAASLIAGTKADFPSIFDQRRDRRAEDKR